MLIAHFPPSPLVSLLPSPLSSYPPTDVEVFNRNCPVAASFLLEQCKYDFLSGRVSMQASTDAKLR